MRITLKGMSVFLALLLVLNMVCFAEERQVSDFEYKKQLVDTIFEETAFEGDTVTRAEFLYVISKICGVIPLPAEEMYFEDVTQAQPYCDYIYSAAQRGYISKGQFFYPDEEISYYEAVKIAVSFLGYGLYAAYNGGYPAGYLQAAKQTKLLKDVGGTELFDASSAYLLVFNVLHASQLEITGVGKTNEYSDDGPSLLEHLYDISMIKGTVTATVYNSLLGDETAAISEIYIDGELYFYDQAVPDMLGRYFRVYADSDRRVRYMYPERNDIIQLSIRDDLIIDGTKAIYLDPVTGKDKTFRLDPSFYFIYNGKKADISEIDFEHLLGEVMLVDCNNDRNYDTVFVTEYDFMTVSRYAKSTKTISDDNGYSIDLSGDVRYVLYAADGTPAALDSLQTDTVLKVIKSLDGKLVSLQFLDNSLNCYVSSVDTEKNTIRSREDKYYLSEYFRKEHTITAGTEATFVMCEDIVVSAKRYDDQWQYGYLINYHINTIFDDEIKLRVLNQTSKIEDSLLHTTVTIDGVRYKNLSAAKFRELFLPSGVFQPQLIRIRKNTNGFITGIDRAVVSDSSKIEKKDNEDDSLTRYTFKDSTFLYKQSYKNCAPYFNMETALVFIIPADAAQTEKYSVTTSSYFFNDQRISPLVYDLDENLSAGAIVFTEDFSNKDLGFGNTYLITDIGKAIDDEGNSGYRLELWCNNRFYYYFAPDELFVQKHDRIYTSSSPEVLCPGDLARLAVNSDNEIISMTVDFDANPQVFDRNGSSAPFNGSNSTPMYQAGKVYSSNSSYITLTSTQENGEYDFSLSNLRQFSNKTANIALFHVKRGLFTSATLNDLKTYLANGDDAHFIVLRQNNYTPAAIIIYEGLEEIRK